jgi:HSP20 family protein
MTLAPFSSRRRRGGPALTATPVTRWDPYREMDDINNRFHQLIQTFLGDASDGTASPLAVPVDVEETDNAYRVDVDLPNVDPQDVSIEMRGEELRISGRYQQREREGVVRRQNRPTGDFEYVIDLPSDIDSNQVEATYGNGVLTVSVAKKKGTQPRRIEIRGQQGQERLGQSGGRRSAQQQSGQQQPAESERAQA